jgi:hypothetical protein
VDVDTFSLPKWNPVCLIELRLRPGQELKKEIATLTATVKEQAAQIQMVSAQFEVSKPAPQTVNNP